MTYRSRDKKTRLRAGWRARDLSKTALVDQADLTCNLDKIKVKHGALGAFLAAGDSATSDRHALWYIEGESGRFDELSGGMKIEKAREESMHKDAP